MKRTYDQGLEDGIRLARKCDVEDIDNLIRISKMGDGANADIFIWLKGRLRPIERILEEAHAETAK